LEEEASLIEEELNGLYKELDATRDEEE